VAVDALLQNRGHMIFIKLFLKSSVNYIYIYIYILRVSRLPFQ